MVLTRGKAVAVIQSLSIHYMCEYSVVSYRGAKARVP